MDCRTISDLPRIILLGFFLFVTIQNASGYNVLILAPFASLSHRLVIDPVAESLGKRGNNVTVISSIKELRPISGVVFKYMKETEIQMNDQSFDFFSAQDNESEFIAILMDLVERACLSAFEDPYYQELLAVPRHVKSVYDVVVIDGTFNECSLALSYHMGVPTVYLATAPAFQAIIWNMNIPFPLSYLMNAFGETVGQMTFWERGKNLAGSMLFLLYLRHQGLHPRLEEIVRRYVPDSPSFQNLERNVSFLLSNTHVALYPSAPSMPYYVNSGCLSCVEAKKLPKELDDFLKSGSNGAIFFSLGSYTKSNSMPLAFRNKIIDAFSRIPQKVLWKFDLPIDNLSSNLKLVKWAPQQDILAHPNLRLFITHGGGLSTQEAAYHGCPILGFPLAVDQVGNIAHAVSKGFGEVLKWRDFEADELVELITRMTSDTRYKENAKQVSMLMKDNIVDPKDNAAYWIEYVARHKGAPHLKSGAEKLNLFQYHLLDVIGAALLIVFAVLLVIFFLIRSVFRFLCSGKSSKNKKKMQ